MMKRIILTGGGTAGHVTPNIALIPALKRQGYEIYYIGSYEGMEKSLIEEQGIPYYGISSGKLRRYKSIKNLSDPFRVVKGYFEAKKLMKQLKPDIVFSKGGFVTVPVVLAAKGKNIPAIIHESDMTPGLANRICIPRATKVCANFTETIDKLPAQKAILTGTPIRQELFSGNRIKGAQFCGFSLNKPILMVTGGSLGALKVNQGIRSILPKLLEHFQVVHLCGNGKLDESLLNTKGYVQFEYVKEEMADLFAAADLVISRAGANTIFELLALKKPNLLIPLSAASSRGDQILNANSFEKQGYSKVLKEEDMNETSLYEAIMDLYENRQAYIEVMGSSKLNNSIDTIVSLINQVAR